MLLDQELRGIVQRVTFHNPENGWSVLKVQPFDAPMETATVVVHQTKVFAGATMRFQGAWVENARFGRQFKASQATEMKPATAAALEKYLGSGLIRGVGPKTAKRIVKHFGDQTLAVFEKEIARLMEVPGIARRKLEMIETAWKEHRAIRDVMLFLQSHGISTLFAVRIYKEYGDRAITIVTADPYRLALDFYGIGFFSADRVALSLGYARDSEQRLTAAIRHVLAASREQGHCYLTAAQVATGVNELLEFEAGEQVATLLLRMEAEGLLKVRELADETGEPRPCYYSKSLYHDERTVAERLRALRGLVAMDSSRLDRLLDHLSRTQGLALSAEQRTAVSGIITQRFSVLTGGPGCGKTTTTRLVVAAATALGRRVLLAAPTGRAAQRMSEVIGSEARTIHRLLEWQPQGFQKNEHAPLDVDLLVVDECSMLDITLAAAILKAVPANAQVLFIGDADQLPAVGAGNVLGDLIASRSVPCFRLTEIFRQARSSAIIRHAHQINRGETPAVESPFRTPQAWRDGTDCLFIDAEEATREQLSFLTRVRQHFSVPAGGAGGHGVNPYEFRTDEPVAPYETELAIPEKFRHVDLQRLLAARTHTEELLAVLKKVHPWSALHYRLAASDVVRRLCLDWIPKYFGPSTEIQVLSPMTRGSLGTRSLNALLQQTANPPAAGKKELAVGEKVLREGDRVIHTRNNYELGVFNGDIGVVRAIDNEELTCEVTFATEGGRNVVYQRENLMELELAYAITIHKSQGSEFEAVVMPVLTQHFKMLYRNLLYTGLTRARRLAVLVGTRKALAMAVRNRDTAMRQTALRELLREEPQRWG